MPPPLDAATLEAYLERIGIHERPALDLAGLAALQHAHLCAVPFENLDVYHQRGVRTDLPYSIDKVVRRRRGGWCFELNGAFGALLESLGFSVLRLGAAVLFNGPTTVIDHLTLEVALDQPYLVDVGFGESFVEPLRLTNPEPQAGYQLLASPQGTTLAKVVDGVPEAHYRFKRVHHELGDFEAASTLLQSDPDKHWRNKPFATRLLGIDEAGETIGEPSGPTDRITLTTDELKITRAAKVSTTAVAPNEWSAILERYFGLADTLERPKFSVPKTT